MAFTKDGTHKYGSIVLTIDAITYVAENFETSQPSNAVEVTNENGEPAGQVIVPGFVTGSATLQLATAATALPAIGDEFTVDTVAYIVSEVGESRTQNDITKCNISFRKKINTVVVV